jgi:hypothetical protein
VGFYYDPATGRPLSAISSCGLTTFQFEDQSPPGQDISPTGTVVGFHRSSLSGPLPDLRFHNGQGDDIL